MIKSEIEKMAEATVQKLKAEKEQQRKRAQHAKEQEQRARDTISALLQKLSMKVSEADRRAPSMQRWA